MPKKSEEPNVVAVWPIPTRDEFVSILRAGYRAIIIEADEWRPIAGYVRDICYAVVKGYRE